MKAAITVNGREVEDALRRRFGSARELRRFLRLSGLSLSDERLVAKAELLRERWTYLLPVYQKLRHRKGRETSQLVAEIDNELQHLHERLAANGTRITQCRADYVVSGCSEFRR